MAEDFHSISVLEPGCCLLPRVSFKSNAASSLQVSPSQAFRWMPWTRSCWTCRMKWRPGNPAIRLWSPAQTTLCTKLKSSPCCPALAAAAGRSGYKVRQSAAMCGLGCKKKTSFVCVSVCPLKATVPPCVACSLTPLTKKEEGRNMGSTLKTYFILKGLWWIMTNVEEDRWSYTDSSIYSINVISRCCATEVQRDLISCSAVMVM